MKTENGIKTSRDYAKKLRELADFLDGVPEFKLPDYSGIHYAENGLEHMRYYEEKQPFLDAVKALGSVQKKADERAFTVLAAKGLVSLSVNRDAVCRIIKPAQPAEYKCEPLLSQAEEAEIGA